MYFTQHWPDMQEVKSCLSDTELDETLAHLLAPFNDIEAAKSFWQECDCAFAIINANDSIECFQQLTLVQQDWIKHAIQYPEYQTQLGQSSNEQGTAFKLLFLGIISDDGAGCYVVIDQQSPCLSHLQHA